MTRARHIRRLLTGVILASVLSPASRDGLAAQEPSVALVGSRLRVRTAAPSRLLVGTVSLHTRDSLVLEPGGPAAGPVTLMAGEILSVEVQRGRRRHWLLGAAIGAVAGGAGSFIWARSGFCDSRGRGDGSCGGADAAVAAVGFGAGGLLGAGVGALVRSDRWVPLRDYPTLGPGRASTR